MEKLFEIMGDFTETKTVTIDPQLSPIEVIKAFDLKMRENRRIIGVQVGGVLGTIVFGNEMKAPITKNLDDLSSNHLLYFSQLFCPVDYLRFLSRFLIREIGIDTDATRDLNEWIEAISQGNLKIEGYNHIEKLLRNLGDSLAEKKVKALYGKIILHFKDEILEHIEEKKCKTGICRTLITAQCINACPAEIHIPGYVALMKVGATKKAYQLMRQKNPLSLICGRICARPCEDRCRRKEIESTVGVRALQRYASNHALKNEAWHEDRLPDNGKTIGIIGAGPAGLTAAYYLQKSGYQVEIYEKSNVPGGMLRSCVPAYRMPTEELMLEIETITALGVKIHYGCEIGRDVSLQELNNTHHSIIIAVGAQKGVGLKELMTDQTETAIDFLRSVRLDNRQSIGEKVVVLGGGDVAMDAARTAIRLGAESVNVVSLESYENMPASAEDKEQSVAEGVNFHNGYGILDCTDDLKITLQSCLSVIDLEGKFSPVFSNKNEKSIQADQLILAIGQRPDIGFVKSSIENSRGFISVNKRTGMTSLANVYAVGDVVENDIAINAIAKARKVAETIDKHLGGVGIYSGESIEIPEGKLSIRTWDDERCLEPTRPIESIKGDFEAIDLLFNENDASFEANRCLRCDRNSTQPLWLRPRNENN